MPKRISIGEGGVDHLNSMLGELVRKISDILLFIEEYKVGGPFDRQDEFRSLLKRIVIDKDHTARDEALKILEGVK